MTTTVANFPFQLDVKSMREQKSDEGLFAYFTGYAAVFNNVDHHNDVIAPGAFRNSLASGRKIKLLWEHMSNCPIGSFKSMQEDANGLLVEARINLGTQKGAEAYALLKANDVDSMSIGWITKDYEVDSKGVRHIKECDLYEASIVSMPANDQARILTVKSVREAVTLAQLETLLTERGFSAKAAKAFLSQARDLTLQHRDDVKAPDTKQRDVVDESDNLAALRLLQHIRNETNKLKG